MRPTAALPLLLSLGACHIGWDGDHSNFVVDGYELPYERTVGLVLGDLRGQHLAFDSAYGDVSVVPVEGESRVVVALREVYPRDGELVFADGRLTLRGGEERPVAAEWVRFEVGQPLHSVQLSTEFGDLEVDQVAIATELRLETGMGDIRVYGVGELTHLKLNSGLGDVRIEDCGVERIEANSGLGDVDLRRVRTAHAVLRTGLGDVDIDGSDIELLDADTGLGDVDASGSAIGRIEASSGLGRVDFVQR